MKLIIQYTIDLQLRETEAVKFISSVITLQEIIAHTRYDIKKGVKKITNP